LACRDLILGLEKIQLFEITKLNFLFYIPGFSGFFCGGLHGFSWGLDRIDLFVWFTSDLFCRTFTISGCMIHFGKSISVNFAKNSLRLDWKTDAAWDSLRGWANYLWFYSVRKSFHAKNLHFIGLNIICMCFIQI